MFLSYDYTMIPFYLDFYLSFITDMSNTACYPLRALVVPVVVVVVVFCFFFCWVRVVQCLDFFFFLVFAFCLAPEVANVVELSNDDCPFSFLWHLLSILKTCVHATAIYTNRTNDNKVTFDNINLIPEANLDAIA